MDAATIAPCGRVATYDEIAGEYYNAERHPTCASLRELSSYYIVPRVQRLSGHENLVVEVGAGRTIVAPIWESLGFDLRAVHLVDCSPEMLAYSSDWEPKGVCLDVAYADQTGLPSGSTDIVVASLGDPYNTADLWREVARVLRPGGLCHFTTPAAEWASKFRSPETSSTAEFLRADGSVLFMPSPVFTDEQQADMFALAGLELVDATAFTVMNLQSEPAPKLLSVSNDTPVLRGYSVRR